MLKKTQHLKRLIQPMPLLAVAVAKQLDFDIEMQIAKKFHLNQKGTVPKMKLVAEGKEEEKELKEKIAEIIPPFTSLEFKRGHIQVKAKK